MFTPETEQEIFAAMTLASCGERVFLSPRAWHEILHAARSWDAHMSGFRNHPINLGGATIFASEQPDGSLKIE